MRSRSFRSVGWVATVAGAALGCYLVSLRVASERAALEDVETRIVMTQRDIRLLQTEIGTRGRLAQLERWNVKVLALSAPNADQFVEGGFALAKLTRPEHKVDLDAPVVLASAPVVNAPAAKVIEADYRPDEAPQPSLPANALMHQASLKQVTRPEPARAAEPPAPKAATSVAPKATKPAPKAATTVASKDTKQAPKAAAMVAPKETKPSPKAAANSAKPAKGDPLAPLPGASPSAKAPKLIPVASATSHSPLKDSGQAQ